MWRTKNVGRTDVSIFTPLHATRTIAGRVQNKQTAIDDGGKPQSSRTQEKHSTPNHFCHHHRPRIHTYSKLFLLLCYYIVYILLLVLVYKILVVNRSINNLNNKIIICYLISRYTE